MLSGEKETWTAGERGGLVASGWLGALAQAALIVGWLFAVHETDPWFSGSYYACYAFVGGLALMALTINQWSRKIHCRDLGFGSLAAIAVMSLLFAGAVASAEYRLFGQGIAKPWCYWRLAVCLAGTFFAGINIGICGTVQLRRFRWQATRRMMSPRQVFLMSFAFLCISYLAFLFLAQYPGLLSADSVWQLRQALRLTSCHNHHPVYHTFVIAMCMKVGTALFGDVNAGVAFYSVVQILFLSCCLSYMLATLHRTGVSIAFVLLALAWYVIAPFHLFYSCTMWKNIPFACATVLLLTTLFRMLFGMQDGRDKWLAVVSALAFCLFLSNGFAAFAVTMPILLYVFRKRSRWVFWAFPAAFLAAFFLRGPVLKSAGIPQPHFIEPLAIPFQQIARVVSEGLPLEAEEEALLLSWGGRESIKNHYCPDWYDVLKNSILEQDDFISEHRGAYLKLWLKLGLRYPGSYFRAWVDQTCGYWNCAGYPGYKIQADTIPSARECGVLIQTSEGNRWHRLAFKYQELFERISGLHVFQSIGLHVWVVLFMFVFCLVYNRPGWVLFVPVLVLCASFLAAAPVRHEIRYFYHLFATLPILIAAPFCVSDKDNA